jgi:TPR repeat protein
MLGKLYFEGRGVEQSYERAAKAWEQTPQVCHEVCSDKCDENEDRMIWTQSPVVESSVCLADLYEKGWGVEQSYEKAFMLYNDYAQLFTPADFDTRKESLYLVKAWERLGYLYQHGLGVEKDEKQAMDCFREARAAQDEIRRMARGKLGELAEIAIQQRKRKRDEEFPESDLEPPCKKMHSESEEKLQ